MARINLFISEITDEIKKILVYISDINNPDIRLLYSSSAKFSKEDKKILDHILKTAIDVSSKRVNADETCIEWDKNDWKYSCTKDDISHAVNYFSQLQESYILGHKNIRRIFFFEARHKSHLPDTFIHLDQIASIQKFKEKIKELGIEPFNLKDTSLFSHSTKDIYKEKATGNYWYLDKLHKNHYEVFDPTGKMHLGDGSMEGILDKNKADKTKIKLSL